MKKLLPILAVLGLAGLSASELNAQTITTDPLAVTALCPGDSITVSYQASGAFGEKNAFSVQLSSANGTFTSFTNLGGKKSMTSGSIKVGVPTLEASGSYRVRVISSMPYLVGSDNGSDVNVGTVPPVFLEADKLGVAVMEPVQFKPVNYDPVDPNKKAPAGLSYFWEFGDDAIPTTSTDSLPPPVVFSTGGFKQVSLTVTNASGCSKTLMSHEAVFVGDCFPKIPADALVVDIDTTYGGGPSRSVWIRPGARHYNGGGGMQIFVEPGGILNGGGGSCTIFLRAGAEMNSGGGSHEIIYENGASLTKASGVRILCNALGYNYEDAPPVIQRASVNEIGAASSVKVLQNGATLSICSSSAMIGKVEVFDLLGRLVQSQQANSNDCNIDMKTSGNGKYIVRINAGGKIISKMISVAIR